LLPSGPGGVYSVSLREDRYDHHYTKAVLAKGGVLSLNKLNYTSRDKMIAESLMLENKYEVSSAHILQLVKRSNCSAYDCEFVALAKVINIPLVTA
jgi:predicted nucleic acid-binding protein